MILFQIFSQKTKKNWGGPGGCPNDSGGVGKIFEVKFKKSKRRDGYSGQESRNQTTAIKKEN